MSTSVAPFGVSGCSCPSRAAEDRAYVDPRCHYHGSSDPSLRGVTALMVDTEARITGDYHVFRDSVGRRYTVDGMTIAALVGRYGIWREHVELWCYGDDFRPLSFLTREQAERRAAELRTKYAYGRYVVRPLADADLGN